MTSKAHSTIACESQRCLCRQSRDRQRSCGRLRIRWVDCSVPRQRWSDTARLECAVHCGRDQSDGYSVGSHGTAGTAAQAFGPYSLPLYCTVFEPNGTRSFPTAFDSAVAQPVIRLNCATIQQRRHAPWAARCDRIRPCWVGLLWIAVDCCGLAQTDLELRDAVQRPVR